MTDTTTVNARYLAPGDAAQYYTQARAAAVAEPHAASCRRIPERLWPEETS